MCVTCVSQVCFIEGLEQDRDRHFCDSIPEYICKCCKLFSLICTNSSIHFTVKYWYDSLKQGCWHSIKGKGDQKGQVRMFSAAGFALLDTRDGFLSNQSK